MGVPLTRPPETFLSSRDNIKLPDFCCPPTEASFTWDANIVVTTSLVPTRSAETVLGDIVEDRLASMSPQEADEAIERARAILSSGKSPKKQP